MRRRENLVSSERATQEEEVLATVFPIKLTDGSHATGEEVVRAFADLRGEFDYEVLVGL